MDAEVDVAVVGGGVVGCAVASALSRAGRSVLLLEAAQRLGDGVTSRNSGVIHSGLYYPPASLKAQACVSGIDRRGPLYDLATARGPVRAERVVNAAGLHADEVAALAGVARYQVHPWRGDYFRFAPAAPFRHLVYPVRRRGAAGLGVHLTLDLAGRCRLGPDVEHVARKDDLSPREDKLPAFLAAARELLGEVRAEQLAYDGCGIRPKLWAPRTRRCGTSPSSRWPSASAPSRARAGTTPPRARRPCSRPRHP